MWLEETNLMTVQEQAFVKQREEMLDDVFAFVESHQDQLLYQNDVIRGLENQFPESLVISALWRLLDMHRLDLNSKLALVPASNHASWGVLPVSTGVIPTSE